MSTQDEKLRLRASQITERMLSYLENAVADAQRLGLVRVTDCREAARMLHSLKTGAITEAKIHNNPAILAGLPDAAMRLIGADPLPHVSTAA
jgi:hypothetical protein